LEVENRDWIKTPRPQEKKMIAIGHIETQDKLVNT
jgi:hypothetical protein